MIKMYKNIKRAYVLIDERQHYIKSLKEVYDNVLIITKIPNNDCLGPLASTYKLTWQDMSGFWETAVQKMYNNYHTAMVYALLDDNKNRIRFVDGMDNDLITYAKSLEKQYPYLIFEFLVTNPSGNIRSNAIDKKRKYLFGIGGAFTKKTPLCTSRIFTERTGKIADFFSNGVGYYNKHSTSSFSHVLTVVVGRKDGPKEDTNVEFPMN